MTAKKPTSGSANSARAGANKKTGGVTAKGKANNGSNKVPGYKMSGNEEAAGQKRTLMQGSSANKRGKAAFRKSGGGGKK